MTPVLTFCWSVHIHVETQVCADPTLPTANGSGKSSKFAWSVTQDLALKRRGIRNKPFWSIFGGYAGVLPGHCRALPECWDLRSYIHFDNHNFTMLPYWENIACIVPLRRLRELRTLFNIACTLPLRTLRAFNAIHRIPCSIESIDVALAGAVVSLFGACRKE